MLAALNVKTIVACNQTKNIIEKPASSFPGKFKYDNSEKENHNENQTENEFKIPENPNAIEVPSANINYVAN